MKYQKITETVEAYRFHAGPGPHTWPEGWLDAPHSIIGDGHCRISDNYVTMNLDATDGSWIIRDRDGCFHVTSDEMFQRMYEPIKELA